PEPGAALPRRRRRWNLRRRRVLPAPRRSRGLWAAPRPGGHRPRPRVDLARGRRGRRRARRRAGRRGLRRPPVSEPRSYHGQPVIKEPIWTWEIPCYFFTGGLGGASAGLAYLSEVRGNDVLARRAWITALAGVGVSPVLLISDLGRPARFFNMLRMFKVTSPMSVGSWILSVSGAATTVAAANALTGWFPRTSRIARPAAALFGLPLSTYTAALVANTAVPVWHEARRILPFVFGSGAALSAGAATVIITPPEHAAAARRLALAS